MTRLRVALLLLVAETLAGDMFLFNPSESTEREYENLRKRQEVTRGQSFGLEKFLTQSFQLDEEEFRPKPFMPSAPNRPRTKKPQERGQTYGLENLTPQVFQTGNFPQDSSEINIAEEENFEMKKTSKTNERRPQQSFKVPTETTKRHQFEPLGFDDSPFTSEAPAAPVRPKKPRPNVNRRKQEVTAAPMIIPEEFHIFPKESEDQKQLDTQHLDNPFAFLGLNFDPSSIQETTESEIVIMQDTPRPKKRIVRRRKKKQPQRIGTTESSNPITQDELTAFEEDDKPTDLPRQEEDRKPLSPKFEGNKRQRLPSRFNEEKKKPFLPNFGSDDVKPTLITEEADEDQRKPFLPKFEKEDRRPYIPSFEEEKSQYFEKDKEEIRIPPTFENKPNMRFEEDERRQPQKFEEEQRRQPQKFEEDQRRQPQKFEEDQRRQPQKFEEDQQRHPQNFEEDRKQPPRFDEEEVQRPPRFREKRPRIPPVLKNEVITTVDPSVEEEKPTLQPNHEPENVPPKRLLERNENQFKLRLEHEFRPKPQLDFKPLPDLDFDPLLQLKDISGPGTTPKLEKRPNELRNKLKRLRPETTAPTTTEQPPVTPVREESHPTKPAEVEQIQPTREQNGNDIEQKKEIEDRRDQVGEEPKPQPSTHHLKTLLKQQSGTLSLSELLQTQNLSLADFLRGNKGAISALGGKKVDSDENVEEPEEVKKEKEPKDKPRLPKISPKSRPFSKQSNDISRFDEKQTKQKQEEEHKETLPKVLDVFEITSEKPTYNGFQPKHPRNRQRLDSRLPKTESEKLAEEIEQPKFVPKTQEPKHNHREPTTTQTPKNIEPEAPTKRDRIRFANRLQSTVTPKETTDAKPLPKRFGELRPKLRIDRRKSTTESATEPPVTENNEIVSTEKISEPTEKSIVRIPFMSSNNPDLPLIVPSRNRTQWNDRRNRDRLAPMRTRYQEEEEEKSTTETSDGFYSKFKFKNTQKPKTTTTTTEATTTEELTTKHQETSNSFDSQKEVQKSEEIAKAEGNDEIVELLKSGSSAQRLARILASRNMTLEELIENRERETSKINNFENLFDQPKTSSSTTTTTTTTERVSRKHKEEEPGIDSFLFPNFPEFGNNAIHTRTQPVKELKELLAEESYPASVQVRPDNQDRDPRIYGSYPKYETQDPTTSKPPPVWNEEKSIYSSNPYSYPTYETGYSGRGGIVKTRVTPTTQDHTRLYEGPTDNNLDLEHDEVILLETINKTASATTNLKNSIDEILKEQTEIHHTKEEYNKMLIPPAVRSAIIASGVVLGIALFVFIAIFVACGCRQRQIRLRGKGSILSDSLSRSNSNLKSTKKNNTLSPISFKRTGMYRKALDFETASSVSNSSNASSYLWNTLKNTFQSRNSTLKNMKNEEIRQENERKREDERRNTLKKDKSVKNEEQERRSTLRRQEEDRGIFTKIDPDRNVINTSLTFKRGGLNMTNAGRFNTCAHLNN